MEKAKYERKYKMFKGGIKKTEHLNKSNSKSKNWVKAEWEENIN